jgi:hypothetical protein
MHHLIHTAAAVLAVWSFLCAFVGMLLGVLIGRVSKRT